MIPVRLALRNFMCYGDNVSPLSFEGFRLACLSGDNGHGKSAILDAITWAVWGRARAKSDDELIQLGRQEMEVDFEFLLGDVHYRVVRKRLRPKSEKGSGQTVLELHVGNDGAFRSITGNTVRDTERKIVDLLRMEYDTFINSAFILQGRADEFTVKAPGDRKKVLSEILSLSYYDRLEERAREEARTRENRRRELASAITEIDKELEKKTQYEQELRELDLAIVSLDSRVRVQEAELNGLRERKKALDFKAEQVKELQKKLAYASREIDELGKQLVEHQVRVADFERVQAKREEIEDGFRRLVGARQDNETQNAKLRQHHQLVETRSQLVRKVDDLRNELTTQRRLLQREIERLEPKWQMLAVWERELVDANRSLYGLAKLDTEREEKRRQANDLANRIEVLRAENVRLREEMNALKGKVDFLTQADASCPLCETELGEDGKQKIQEKYSREGREKAEAYRANEKEVKTLVEGRDRLEREANELETKISRDRDAASRKVGTLEKNVADAKSAIDEISGLKSKLADIDKTLETGSYAESEQAMVAHLDSELQALAYDPGRQEELRRLCDELAKFEDLYRRLDEADRLISQEQNAVSRSGATLERWRSESADDTSRKAMIEEELTEMPALAGQISSASHLFEALVVTWNQERVRLGAVQQKVKHCEYLQGQKAEKLDDLNWAAKEKAIYDELAVALGKKGIQAMIIEAAIPEIQNEANVILARMTDSRMAIAFETQRDTKKGDTVETLDIKIADELGTRNYETYSGGEAFRINFAIRVALSKMLAHRAGARLQTLVIDEGFGSQDAAGREKLVEAINAIQDDFEKVIVITHIQELKDLFPVRIEVTKTADGSTICVN